MLLDKRALPIFRLERLVVRISRRRILQENYIGQLVPMRAVAGVD